MKRFTDCSKWDSEFHFGLSQTEVIAWSLLNDKADGAGVVDIPPPLLAAYVKDPDFSLEDFAETVGATRLIRLENGRWWLPKFIQWQYPDGVHATAKYHSKVRVSVLKNKIPRPIGTGKEKADQLARLSAKVLDEYRAHNAWVAETTGERAVELGMSQSELPLPQPCDERTVKKNGAKKDFDPKTIDLGWWADRIVRAYCGPLERPRSNEAMKVIARQLMAQRAEPEVMLAKVEAIVQHIIETWQPAERRRFVPNPYTFFEDGLWDNDPAAFPSRAAEAAKRFDGKRAFDEGTVPIDKDESPIALKFED